MRGREREREERSECAYAQVHALGPNGKTLQVFFYCSVVKARPFFLFFFYKSYHTLRTFLGVL